MALRRYWLMNKLFINGFILIVACTILTSCAGIRPNNLGISDSLLAACPPTPNCVSSDAQDADHKIDPFRLAAPVAEVWRVTREMVLEMPRTHIVEETLDYLYLESKTALLGFVDDFELHLRASKGIIAVRSAARLGYSDFGVNRNRVEALRSALIGRGVVE
jgi:uncharacterized protein (DUF1499 family)